VREAAASDTASVIIEGSCASEGVTDGRNGFLIEENAASLAAKLRELIDRPETVRKVGEGAGSELYISWADAVANAYERYEVVIDNYKSGLYGRHDPLKGSWMQSQGELMEILGDIEAARKDLDTNLRSARNKAIVDVISAGYEARENIRELRNEALNDLESLLDEVSQSFWDGSGRRRKAKKRDKNE
jgi:vacuolar-type H+-ATPase subunit H